MRLGRWRTISKSAGASALRLIAVHHGLASAAHAYQAGGTSERLPEPGSATARGDIEGDAARVRGGDVGVPHARGALQQPLDGRVGEERVDPVDLHARRGIRLGE